MKTMYQAFDEMYKIVEQYKANRPYPIYVHLSVKPIRNSLFELTGYQYHVSFVSKATTGDEMFTEIQHNSDWDTLMQKAHEMLKNLCMRMDAADSART